MKQIQNTLNILYGFCLIILFIPALICWMLYQLLQLPKRREKLKKYKELSEKYKDNNIIQKPEDGSIEESVFRNSFGGGGNK